MKKSGWEECLEAVREIASSGREITSASLLEIMNYQPTERSRAMDIAAGWIGNLRRWGYLKLVIGKKVQGPRRQLQVYALTRWGERYKVRSQKRALKIAANPKKPSGNQG